MFDSELLKILCCPETRQAVQPADGPLLDRLNHQIGAGRLQNRSGRPVTEKLEDGLLTADGKLLYPIRQGIPVLLAPEAIPVI